MTTEQEFYIPIDGAIENFKTHLLSHPRTIFSAEFGDGKSYFLQKFIKEPSIQEQFVFLKLFPVNYQVVENRDVFELIKYDLLFQLFLNGMILETEKLDEKLVLQLFCISHGQDILFELSKWAPMIASSSEQVATIAAITSAIKPLKQLYNKWKTFKKKNGESDCAYNLFLQQQDASILYECDVVTSFVRECIAQYKQHHSEKRIVWLIEDLDRIDPAHLFRILNVLSAHVDYAYKFGQSVDESNICGNKFGVDHVVLVLDYKNLEEIYHHFYGVGTSFNGYIRKFCSDQPFYYSFTNQRYHYVIKYLHEMTHLSEEILQTMLPSGTIEKKTMREIASAILDVDRSIFNIPQYKDINIEVELPKGVLQVLVVLRRLGLSTEEMIAALQRTIVQYPKAIISNIGGYVLVKHNDFSTSMYFPSNRRDMLMFSKIKRPVSSTAICDVEIYYDGNNGDGKLNEYKEFVQWLLSFVGM
jgi:hypothetical protein